MRIEESYLVFLPDHFEGAVSELKRLRKTYGGERLTINTIKVHLDGINMTGTAAMVDPYSDESGSRGTTVVDERRLTKFMGELHLSLIHI